MCGRFTLASPGETIAELFALGDVPRLVARYNIAPTQPVAVIRSRAGGGRELVEMRWGLVPSWARDESLGDRLINARSETVAEKPAFRAALRRRRCLIAADGFYEWRKLGGRKQPFHIRLADGAPFAFAGLWELWSPPGRLPLESCTILTTEPNDLLRPLHDRMPVILEPFAYEAWIDPTVEKTAGLRPLFRPFVAREMVAYQVSTLVNNPGVEGIRCIAPLP